MSDWMLFAVNHWSNSLYAVTHEANPYVLPESDHTRTHNNTDNSCQGFE